MNDSSVLSAIRGGTCCLLGFGVSNMMLTDVLLEGSQLLYVGDDEIISQAFHVTPKDNSVFLPQVMSRKKQIIPSLSALWG